MFTKLDKLRADLLKAKEKRAEWDGKVKELEKKCREEENLTIQGLVHAANISPEQLAALINMSAGEKLQQINNDTTTTMEDDFNDEN